MIYEFVLCARVYSGLFGEARVRGVGVYINIIDDGFLSSRCALRVYRIFLFTFCWKMEMTLFEGSGCDRYIFFFCAASG